MPVFSSVLLVVALILGVVIGPQTRPWTWGPAMLALGFSVAVALPGFWRRSKQTGDFGMHAFGLLVAAWFAWRAWVSPVQEMAAADLMLLAAAVGGFISVREIEGHRLAERILIWGIALLLLANVVVIAKQITDPTFSPVFRARADAFPSGFYAHYNEAANYLIASSLIVASAALLGPYGRATRCAWGLIAIAGLAAIYFTRSRGGILGAAVGTGVFVCGALVIGKRSGARWFPWALVAIPLVGLALAAFLFQGWQGSQEIRKAEAGIRGVLDSNYRLYFLGIALSCIGQHPLLGGGSRSFSWESFQFYDVGVQGSAISHKAEQVHNELVQACTDYGLIGAGLLVGLLGGWTLIAVIRIVFASPSGEEPTTGGAWRLAGLSALAGMFVQSCFSFVFHLMPGILLLGICLGKMSRSTVSGSTLPTGMSSRIPLSFAAIACLLWLVPVGWNSSRTMQILWPSYFSKQATMTPESKTAALTAAIAVWPVSDFYLERAKLRQTMAAAQSGREAEEAIQSAIRDYQQAGNLHSHDPGIQVNLANLLSAERRDLEAEAAYQRAIQLQGGMEPAFQARYFLATHLLRKGQRQFTTDDPSPTLATLEVAAEQMERSVKDMRWAAPNIHDARVAIHENLGAAREANGDYPGARQAYDLASTLIAGSKAHYRAGLLLGKQAAAAWRDRRPAEALTGFIEAKRRIGMASELPGDVTPSNRLEYLTYLDRAIAYLTGARVEPLPTLPE